MSASEKLRAFMADERWGSHDATVLAGLALTLKESGLPQLLAVVEAVELIVPTASHEIVGPYEYVRGDDLYAARTALTALSMRD